MRVLISMMTGSLILLSGCQAVDSLPVTGNELPAPTTITVPIAPSVVPVNILAEAPVIEQAVEITDVWVRISQGLSIPIPDEKLVKQYRDWYIKNPRHLEQVSKRATPFLYLIVEEIEKRNLPIELALLPIVESAFDPFAYSHGAASGLWQFTAPMAKHFGLTMNWWYDGRRDVPAATIAAIDMMEYLHKKTNGNWLYAIAAYNTGEGRVLNAVRKNKRLGKSTDFFSLDLPRETVRYVPQLLALADVIKNADKYGIKLSPISNKPKVKIIDVGSQIDLALAAKMAGITTNELHKLNPGFNRWSTAPDGPHRLVIPIATAEAFTLALNNTKTEGRLNWERYQIKAGDSLGVIAQRYNTTTSALKAVNDIKGNIIVIGKHLLIPVATKDLDQYAQTLTQRTQAKQNVQRGNYKVNYKVKSGDSFWKIAKAHDVSIAKLASWNSMAPKDYLKVGQTLAIWQGDKNTSGVIRTINYTVRSGDSLARIASRFKVSVNELIRWNSLQNSKYLQPGQNLTLHVDMTKIRA